ncbi:excalibur calcium-binding domain-containing protein [Stenotrophomonas sp.]|uniref:excalibur calcium-binding domain-containing protein n=1 Tax=Stenotrophomonas sp. TaxID=69392 RepID=UPI0031BB3480
MPSRRTHRTAQHRATPQQPGPRACSNRPFANCAEARAAGAAPVRRGEPGYGPHLDRDNDGVGCEPYRGRR